MKRISEQVRNNIVSLLDTGLSSRQIAARLGVGRRTVDRVRAKTRPDIQKPRAGRPAKLNATDKRQLVRMITSGKVSTAAHLTRELRSTTDMELSPNTVGRALKEAGLKAVSKVKKPRLLPRHRRQRMDFAVRYQHWTVDDWERVVWSDETKINRIGSDGRKWAWKKPGSALTDQHVEGTLNLAEVR